jgi:DNA-binding beta-propeller fold protein YncE
MGRPASLILGLVVAVATLVWTACGEPVSILGDTPGLMRIVAGAPDEPGRAVGSSATQTLLRFPSGLDMDLDGVLYLTDRGNRRILAVTSAGEVRVVVDDAAACSVDCLLEPIALAVDGTGGLIVADDLGHRVWRFDASTGVRTLLAGTGESETTPDGAIAAASSIRSPRGVAVDQNGRVYFAEGRSHRIRTILPDGTLATVAGTGEAGDGGDGGPATDALIDFPAGIDIANGMLYVADAGNHRVRAVDLATGIITTIAGTGTAGFSGDGGDPLSAALSDPRDVAVASDGLSLYIADRSNDRIRLVSLASPVINTVAGSGDTEFAGNLIDAGVAGLWSPIGVATSPFGLVMISDTEHHIVWRTPTGF